MTDYRVTTFFGEEDVDADQSKRFTSEQSARFEYNREAASWSDPASVRITLVRVNWLTGESQLVASIERNWPYKPTEAPPR